MMKNVKANLPGDTIGQSLFFINPNRDNFVIGKEAEKKMYLLLNKPASILDRALD